MRRAEVGRFGEALVDCVSVGASMLELDGPLGEVDLERTLDGGRSSLELSRDEVLGSCVFANSTCVGSWDGGAWGDSCTHPQEHSPGALGLE